MKGKFEVITITNDWEPPFEKTNVKREFVVEENEDFDEDHNLDSHVFASVELRTDAAIILFSNQYQIKKAQYVTPAGLLIGPGKLRLPLGQEVEFSYMWGTKGTTKKIKYLGQSGETKSNMLNNQSNIIEKDAEFVNAELDDIHDDKSNADI